MKKFFSTPWAYVLVMFLLMTFTGLFNRIFDYLEYWFLSIIPSNNQRVLSSAALLVNLVLPLVLVYWVAKFFLRRNSPYKRNR